MLPRAELVSGDDCLDLGGEGVEEGVSAVVDAEAESHAAFVWGKSVLVVEVWEFGIESVLEFGLHCGGGGWRGWGGNRRERILLF